MHGGPCDESNLQVSGARQQKMEENNVHAGSFSQWLHPEMEKDQPKVYPVFGL